MQIAFIGDDQELSLKLPVANSPSQPVYTVKVHLQEIHLLKLKAFSAENVYSLELRARDVPGHAANTSLLWVKLMIEAAYHRQALQLFYIESKDLKLNLPFEARRTPSEVLSKPAQSEDGDVGALQLQVEYQSEGSVCWISLQLPKILSPIWSCSAPLSPRSSELITLYRSILSQKSVSEKPLSAE